MAGAGRQDRPLPSCKLRQEGRGQVNAVQVRALSHAAASRKFSVRNDERYEPLATDGSYSGHPLREWQKQALGAWEDNGSIGVIEAITGTGKSLVGIAAIRQVIAEGGVAMVVVPTKALVEQWHRELRNALPLARLGRLGAAHKDTFDMCDVLVATVQTASRNPPQPWSLGLLVADEAHRYGSAQFSKVLHSSYERRLALSGTYERQQDNAVVEVLTPYFHGIVYQYYYGEALEDEVVAPFHLALVGAEFEADEERRYAKASQQCSDAQFNLIRYYRYPEHWPDFFAEVQRTRSGSYREQESYLCRQYNEGFSARRTVMAEARAKEAVVGSISNSLAALSGTLVFTETKASANRLAYIVNRLTPAFPLTSESPQHEREEKLRDFARGRLKVLSAPRILDEGIDVPEAELAVIVAASSSRRQMIQRMGRVIRLKADGRAARILLIYVKGTSEDPARGGHEAFLEDVVTFAESQTAFEATDAERISDWIAQVPR